MHFITAYSDGSDESSQLLTALRNSMGSAITETGRQSNVEFSLTLSRVPNIGSQRTSNIYEFVGYTPEEDLRDYLDRARTLRRNSGNGVIGNIAHASTASIALGLHENRNTIINAFRALQIAMLDIGRVYNVHFNLQPTGLQILDGCGNIGQLDNYTINGLMHPTFSHHTDNRSAYYSGVYMLNPEEYPSGVPEEDEPSPFNAEPEDEVEIVDEDIFIPESEAVLLTPTESASGSITIEEQTEYSLTYNRHNKHLCKVAMNGRPILYYLIAEEVLPYIDSADFYIENGLYSGDEADILDVYTFNTPEYWKAIRLLMHRNCRALYEVTARP